MEINYFNLIGLVSNLGGALFLAFSLKVVDPSKDSGGSIKIFGKNLTITTIKKNPFTVGIILLILGFILQLVGVFNS